MKDTFFYPLELEEARNLIAEISPSTSGQVVPLEQASGRVPVDVLNAKIPQPNYDQSTRDGYVISGEGGERDKGGRWYTIGGDIPAGSTRKILLSQGTSFRIMTGGLVPEQGESVVPQENCLEKGGRVYIPDDIAHRPSNFIRRKGCDVAHGNAVALPGIPLAFDRLALLAETGYEELLVYSKPHVSYFCSGSELVLHPSEAEAGKKVSVNRYLLEGMINAFGGVAKNCGLIGDSMEAVSQVFQNIDPDKEDVVISTGGMGPGKYDLLEEAFVQCGGTLLYRSLNVRPGKNTLLGILGKTLYLGFPGPPPAVRTLGNELLRVALLSCQGVQKCHPASFTSHLQESLTFKKKGIPNLIAGIHTINDGHCSVRRCLQGEIPTGYILIPGGRQRYEKEEKVEVHSTESPLV